MLDLRTTTKYYEMIDEEGNVIKINYPSQDFLNKLIKMSESDDAKQNIEDIYDTVYQIMNDNINGKEFSKSYIANFSFETVALILNDYLETVFMNWEK